MKRGMVQIALILVKPLYFPGFPSIPWFAIFPFRAHLPSHFISIIVIFICVDPVHLRFKFFRVDV